MFRLVHKSYIKRNFPTWVKKIINFIFQSKQFYPGSDKDQLLRRRSQQMCGHGKVLWLINNADRRYPAYNDFMFGYTFGETIFCLYHLLQIFNILKLGFSRLCTNRKCSSHVPFWRKTQLFLFLARKPRLLYFKSKGQTGTINLNGTSQDSSHN